MSAVGAALPNYYYRLVSPTVEVVINAAQVNANKTFNTNIPFGKAMLIRRIVAVQAEKSAAGNAVYLNQALWELTEDPSKSSVAQQDPFALADGGIEENVNLLTSGAARTVRAFTAEQRFNFIPPDPGIPTVAQQLNLVCTGLQITGGITTTWDTFVQIYYELIDLSDRIRTFLSNRIALQRIT